jgi:hypothetical protein
LSFAIFLVPLLIGCCFVAPLRAGLLNWRTLASVVIAVAILVLPVNWMIHAPYHYARALQQVAGVAENSSYFANVGAGLLSLLSGPVSFLAPFWIVALLFWRTLRTKGEGDAGWGRALWIALGVSGVALIALVFVVQVTDFKPRYLHPVLLMAPLLFFLWLDRRPANPGAERWFAGVAGVFAIIVFAGLTAQALVEPRDCRNCWLQMPVPALGAELERQGLGDGTVLTESAHIGGNLRLFLPHARVYSPDYPMAEAAPTGRGQCVLIWNSRMHGQTAPEPLVHFLTEHFGGATGNGPIIIVTEPLLRGGGRTDSFGVMRVAGRNGDCTPN